MDVMSAVRTVMMMSTIRFNVRLLFSVIIFAFNSGTDYADSMDPSFLHVLRARLVTNRQSLNP